MAGLVDVFVRFPVAFQMEPWISRLCTMDGATGALVPLDPQAGARQTRQGRQAPGQHPAELGI